MLAWGWTESRNSSVGSCWVGSLQSPPGGCCTYSEPLIPDALSLPASTSSLALARPEGDGIPAPSLLASSRELTAKDPPVDGVLPEHPLFRRGNQGPRKYVACLKLVPLISYSSSSLWSKGEERKLEPVEVGVDERVGRTRNSEDILGGNGENRKDPEHPQTPCAPAPGALCWVLGEAE